MRVILSTATSVWYPLLGVDGTVRNVLVPWTQNNSPAVVSTLLLTPGTFCFLKCNEIKKKTDCAEPAVGN
jgi:hypothetical protein